MAKNVVDTAKYRSSNFRNVISRRSTLRSSSGFGRNSVSPATFQSVSFNVNITKKEPNSNVSFVSMF